MINMIGKDKITEYNFEIIHCGDMESVEAAKQIAQELGLDPMIQ